MEEETRTEALEPQTEGPEEETNSPREGRPYLSRAMTWIFTGSRFIPAATRWLDAINRNRGKEQFEIPSRETAELADSLLRMFVRTGISFGALVGFFAAIIPMLLQLESNSLLRSSNELLQNQIERQAADTEIVRRAQLINIIYAEDCQGPPLDECVPQANLRARQEAVLAFLGIERARGEKRPKLRSATLRGADLRVADFTYADLSNADLSGADLRVADLSNADLSGADLRGANLRGAVLCNVDFFRADLSYADLSNADLSGTDLHDVELLTSAGLNGVDLSYRNFTGMNLRGVNLSAANLRGVHLSGADLRGASLLRADLTGAFLHGTELDNADLRGAILLNTKLGFEDLDGLIPRVLFPLVHEKLSDTIGDKDTKLPDGLPPPPHWF